MGKHRRFLGTQTIYSEQACLGGSQVARFLIKQVTANEKDTKAHKTN